MISISRLQVTCPFSSSAAPLDRSANFPLPIHLLESSKGRSSRVLTWNSQAAISRFSDGRADRSRNENEEEYGLEESKNR